MTDYSLIILSFWKEINTFIQQGFITLIKSDSKDISNVTKDLFWLLFRSFYHLKILKKCLQNKKISSSTVLILIKYVSWSANHHIRMISEGSCDTGAITEINYIINYIKKSDYTSQYCFYCIFDHMNDFQNLTNPKRLNSSVYKYNL